MYLSYVCVWLSVLCVVCACSSSVLHRSVVGILCINLFCFVVSICVVCVVFVVAFVVYLF